MSLLAHLDQARQAVGDRKEARRKLRLLTAALTGRGGVANVQVLDIAPGGLLLRAEVALKPGETIDVQLPGVGARTARVVWANGDYVGCAFDAALSAGAVSAALLRSVPASGPETLPEHTGSVVRGGFGGRLAALREQRGLSIEQLAARLGVSRQAVWYWETGQRLPRSRLLNLIAETLEIESETLLAQPSPQDAVARAVAELRQVVAASLGQDAARIRISIELD